MGNGSDCIFMSISKKEPKYFELANLHDALSFFCIDDVLFKGPAITLMISSRTCGIVHGFLNETHFIVEGAYMYVLFDDRTCRTRKKINLCFVLQLFQLLCCVPSTATKLMPFSIWSCSSNFLKKGVSFSPLDRTPPEIDDVTRGSKAFGGI